MIDFFAREPHHIEHAKVIYDALPERGRFFTTSEGLMLGDPNRIVAVFCFGDLKMATRAGRKVIYCEHGAGMYYNIVHPSYAGSSESRENVVLRLVPNETCAARERETLTCPVEVVGMPMMDKYAGRVFRLRRRPIVALSFHWDCRVCPETRSAFDHFKDGLEPVSHVYKMIGHAHPRIWRQMQFFYRNSLKIPTAEKFETVLERADIYICDNSSTLYQFALTGKPVILMNAPWYRKDVIHPGNPRFWKHADIGVQVDEPGQLLPAIRHMLTHREDYQEATQAALKDIFTYLDGSATRRAVEAIQKHCL